jgi:hypothetical protein
MRSAFFLSGILLAVVSCSRSGEDAAGAGGGGAAEKTSGAAAAASSSGAAKTKAAGAAGAAGTRPAVTASAGGGAKGSNLDPLRPLRSEGEPAELPEMKKLPSGLAYAVLKEGSGESPPPRARLKLHYTAWAIQQDQLGTAFIDTRRGGVPKDCTLKPLDVTAGLISGLVEALKEMKRGERRWLIVPSMLAWGQEGNLPHVPRNANVAFDLELVDFEK